MLQKILLSLVILTLAYSQSLGQSFQLSGRVIDDDTEEGLPFCNVYFLGTTTGVSTDIDGYYVFNLDEKPSDTLKITAIGYEDRAKYIGDEVEQSYTFRMKAAGLDLVEVVVLAGENPANDIVRGIIKNKPKNNIANRETYQCETYQKLEMDLDNIDRLENRKILKQFDFVFDNIDTTSDVKPFLPAFITETLYDVYHVKGSPLKEIPKAIKVSGVENQTIVDLLNTFQEKFNVYDNWLRILEKQFVSPFADNGLRYYEYYIQDTMMIDGQRSIKLKFKPKRKQENTFYGHFWVADSLYAVQRVNMRMSPDVNINLVHRIIIYQEFGITNDSIFVPVKEKGIIDFAAIKNAPGIIGRRTNTYRKYQFDIPKLDSIYKEKDPEAYYMPDLKKDDEFWEEARHEKLEENELKIYDMVDSIQNVPIFKTYSKIIQTVGTGWYVTGPVEWGNLYTIYSSNAIQGQRLRLDLGTSNKLSKKLRVWGYGAYGFKDKKFRYGGNFQWNIRKGVKRTILGGSHKNDVSYTNNSSEDFGDGDIFTSLYRRNLQERIISETTLSPSGDTIVNNFLVSAERMLRVNESKIFIEHDWKKGWSNRLTFLYRDMDPFGGKNLHSRGQWNGFDFKYNPDLQDPTRIDTTVQAAEIILNTRYAFGERVLQGEFEEISLGSKFPIVTLQLAAGISGILGSKHNYQKVVLGIEHYFYLNPIGWTEYEFKAGKVFGTLPYLLLETHPGNETFFYSEKAFNTMSRFEFVSDAYASLYVQHHFDGFLFNKIPFLRKLDLRLVTDFKAVIGTLSDDNKAVNFIDHPDPNQRVDIISPSPIPYMEAGVGIENILKLLRLEGIWRLNYRDRLNAQKFSIRLGIDFNF